MNTGNGTIKKSTIIIYERKVVLTAFCACKQYPSLMGIITIGHKGAQSKSWDQKVNWNGKLCTWGCKG